MREEAQCRHRTGGNVRVASPTVPEFIQRSSTRRWCLHLWRKSWQRLRPASLLQICQWVLPASCPCAHGRHFLLKSQQSQRWTWREITTPWWKSLIASLGAHAIDCRDGRDIRRDVRREDDRLALLSWIFKPKPRPGPKTALGVAVPDKVCLCINLQLLLTGSLLNKAQLKAMLPQLKTEMHSKLSHSA